MQHAQPHPMHDPFQQQGWPQPQQVGAAPMQLAPMAPPMSAAVQSNRVTGGGAAAPTATRLRWGRLALVFVGIAIVGLAIWSASAPSSPDKAGTGNAGVRDIGGSLTPLDDTADTNASSDAASEPSSPAVAEPAATSAVDAAPAVGAVPAATTAPKAAAVVRGGGGPAPAATGELPYTGAETWIAAFLGVLILGLGICVQVNAVRIGMTAMLYRRGILLRPIDCARLANERGFGSIRVALSNALHRLLAEPEGNDFVHARHA